MDILFPFPEDISKDKPNTWKPYLPIKVVFVIGAPGAGKGTICEQAATKLGYFRLSTGDYLRDLANRPDQHPQEAHAGLSPDTLVQVMKGAGLITSEEIVEILRFKLEKEYRSGFTKVIIDGFPRTLESAWAYEKLFGRPSTVILADCPKEVAASRFLSRGREKGDTLEKFDKRYEQFVQGTPDILRRYQGLYKKIDTNREKAQAVRAAIKHLEAQETLMDRTQRMIADNLDWKARIAVGAGFVIGSLVLRRRPWRRW